MSANKSPRYLYQSDIKSFILKDSFSILGEIHNNYHGNTNTLTDEAWMEEIRIMQSVLEPWKDEDAKIIFEYDIPRLGKRIDIVLLLRGIIFCIECKNNEKTTERQQYIEQVMDYALDLKNFHKYSQDRIIAPILLITNYSGHTTKLRTSIYDDKIINPLTTGKSGLREIISSVIEEYAAPPYYNFDNWAISPYSPTPTIIEAAKALYENHSVEDITRHEADKVTTDATIAYIQSIIRHSKENGKKSICFVTGVPGAGKTLVGLEVAVKQTYQENGSLNKEDGAVFSQVMDHSLKSFRKLWLEITERNKKTRVRKRTFLTPVERLANSFKSFIAIAITCSLRLKIP